MAIEDMDLSKLTDEEIALIVGESPQARNRLEQQRIEAKKMRREGTMGKGIYTGATYVAENPLSMISDIKSRLDAKKDEASATTGLQGMEKGDQDRRTLLMNLLRQRQAGQNPAAQPDISAYNVPQGQPPGAPAAPPQAAAPAPAPTPQPTPQPGSAGPMASGYQAGPGQAPAPAPTVEGMPTVVDRLRALVNNMKPGERDNYRGGFEGTGEFPSTQSLAAPNAGPIDRMNSTSSLAEFKKLPPNIRQQWLMRGFNPQTGEWANGR